MLRYLITAFAIIFGLLTVAAADPGVSITIYNDNLGLVKDVRELSIAKGTGILDFNDVASQIDATSVNFRCISIWYFLSRRILGSPEGSPTPCGRWGSGTP